MPIPRNAHPRWSRGMRLAAACCLLCASAAAAIPLKIYAINGHPLGFNSDGKSQGMAVELVQAVQQCIGTHDPVDIIPWARANAVAAREPNVLLLPVVTTPERSRYLHFIGPILNVHIVAYALRNRAEELLANDPSLRSAVAGGKRGSVFVSQAKSAGYNFAYETNSSDSALQMLMMKRIDLWFESEMLAAGAIRETGIDALELKEMQRFPPQFAYLAFSRKTSPTVIRQWGVCLSKIKHDGTLLRIHRKWLPDHALPPDSPR